jgi:HPt (histidine-containing phosphotransfer) domain-containing protein
MMVFTVKSKLSKKFIDQTSEGNVMTIVWDKTACLKRMRDSEDFLNQLIRMFLDDMPEHMKNLTQAINNNNFSQIHFHAHIIKGIAGNLSALQLYHQVHLLELAAKVENKKEIKTLNESIIDCQKNISDEFNSYLIAS